MRILFVCTGNTCRSCMAEGMLKNEAKLNNVDIEVSSAGIYAYMGETASANSTKVMAEIGIDISCHIAKPVTSEILENIDIVLTMTKAHKETLISLFPTFKDKIFTLMEYIGGNGDIADPFGGDINDYRNCRNQLRTAVEKLMMVIKEG